jgi:hypothetical protein
MICWATSIGNKLWEIVSGEDAMQEFADNLIEDGIDEEDIFVFEMEDELDNKYKDMVSFT